MAISHPLCGSNRHDRTAEAAEWWWLWRAASRSAVGYKLCSIIAGSNARAKAPVKPSGQRKDADTPPLWPSPVRGGHRSRHRVVNPADIGILRAQDTRRPYPRLRTPAAEGSSPSTRLWEEAVPSPSWGGLGRGFPSCADPRYARHNAPALLLCCQPSCASLVLEGVSGKTRT